MSTSTKRRTWLVLDVSYLCYRAFHSMGHLSHGDVDTGVPFGVLRDVLSLQQDFQTRHIVFAFDVGRPRRLDILPTYKAKRHDDTTPEEKAAKDRVRYQMRMLRESYLPGIGFSNICYAPTYEADDVIASVCNTIAERGDRAVIVSRDKDFYQLLGPQVSIWNIVKGEPYSEQRLASEYGVSPTQWIDVKAIAGCSSDNVDGIEGVGDKTAAKFLRGALKPESKAYAKIVTGNKTWRFNRELVQLPFPGTPEFTLYRDAATKEGWADVLTTLGIRSLMANVSPWHLD